VHDCLSKLIDIGKLAQSFIASAKGLGLPYSFPDILPSEDHSLAFGQLYPIHLIGQPCLENSGGNGGELGSAKRSMKYIGPQDLVPIISLSVSGDIIVFTGQNAGGKSTTMQAIIEAIYLAQSGLPIFGSGFQLNVKRVIGAVFLERGEGSTFQLLLEKHKALLEELKKCSSSDIVLFIDELGTGTQESGGYEYGKRLLQTLNKHGSSVVFATQILELAKFAQTKLGAQCVNFSLDHTIRPGIGKGGHKELMEKVGIDKLLLE